MFLALAMKHPSMYLDWYAHVPKVKYDFKSSGVAYFNHDLRLNSLDFSVNYEYGNPKTALQLANWYGVKPENVFISSEGASGQNARIIRCLAEKVPKKNEAVVEYPTYEPLLRQVQEHFSRMKRLVRREENAYKLDADELLKLVSDKTGLLVLTNPHAPSGAISDAKELKEVMTIARERGFYVLCDEIYAEFDREKVPTIFSVDRVGHRHDELHESLRSRRTEIGSRTDRQEDCRRIVHGRTQHRGQQPQHSTNYRGRTAV